MTSSKRHQPSTRQISVTPPSSSSSCPVTQPSEVKSFKTVIVGGGPAGVAVLLAASRSGRLQALLDQGVAVVEASDALAVGLLGTYEINSDSTANTFIDCLRFSDHESLQSLQQHIVVKSFIEKGENAASLSDVGKLYELVGHILQDILEAHPKCYVYTKHKVKVARRTKNKNWNVYLQAVNGDTANIVADQLVIATGASQPETRLCGELVAGVNISERFMGKIVQSGTVLTSGGVEALNERLQHKINPSVVIVGGSSSAVAVACSLIAKIRPNILLHDSITILHRRDLRIYYTSAGAALAEGYDEFDENDICPISGRVFRFAGLRLDGRELIMQARGIGGRPPEPRLRLHKLGHNDHAALEIMDRAALIIAAFGYRPNGLPLEDKYGEPIRLNSETSVTAPLVDDKCRVLDDRQCPIPGVFGIGLASGFMPRGALGGEPSFSGQANGLWLWQTAVGGIIVDAILLNCQRRLPVGTSSRAISQSSAAGALISDFSGLKAEREDRAVSMLEAH